jgi:hypothetical protein
MRFDILYIFYIFFLTDPRFAMVLIIFAFFTFVVMLIEWLEPFMCS